MAKKSGWATSLCLICASIAAGALEQGQAATFSAEFHSTTSNVGRGARNISGRVWIGDGKMRIESLDEGHVMALILDSRRHTMFDLVPDQGFYEDVSSITSLMSRPGGPGDFRSYDLRNPCDGVDGETCTKTGVASVAGRDCEEWQFTGKDGSRWDGCIDRQLGVMLRKELNGNLLELTGIKVGKQDPGLFKIPKDLKLVELADCYLRPDFPRCKANAALQR